MTPLHRQLLRQTKAWALGRGYDPARTRELRHEAILVNHRRYLDAIPAYERFATEEGVGAQTDVTEIKRHLMFTDDLFKSYDREWLTERDFARMTAWLTQVYSGVAGVDLSGVASIDAWIDRLAGAGTLLVYSSGTSGHLSFVPRDRANWALFRTASAAYLAPLLVQQMLGSALQRAVLGVGCRLFSPDTLANLGGRIGAGGYDAFFLDFRTGHTGNQTLSRELAPLFRRRHYLFDAAFSPEVLLLAATGGSNGADRRRLHALRATAERQDEHYESLITDLRRSTAEGRKVFAFGAPLQYMALCDRVLAAGKISLAAGSVLLFGGGWKSFTGERCSRATLLERMVEAFGVSEDSIIEGYSMTEMNAFNVRCAFGRFHIPPFIEPAIFDDQLELVEGDDLHGVFGFLDPMAVTYPGFIISGDQVHFVNGVCECGLKGPAVTEISRVSYRDVKGCAGIVASVSV